jgi:hypothetical protein
MSGGASVAGERTTTIDFVARGEVPDEWQLVLVEQGPWPGPIEGELRRLQDRLYGTIDAALQGKVAEKYPESKGKNILIRLDGYNLPTREVAAFFDRFSKGVFSTPDYKEALQNSPFVRGITFQAKLESIK